MWWFPRRFPVCLHWHTATLSHARESFLEARRGWRARVNSRGTRRADRWLRIMCSPRAETRLERAAEQDTTHRTRAERFTLYFYISEQSDAPEAARTSPGVNTHGGECYIWKVGVCEEKCYRKNPYEDLLLWQSFAAPRRGDYVRFAFTAPRLFFRLDFYDLRKVGYAPHRRRHERWVSTFVHLRALVFSENFELRSLSGKLPMPRGCHLKRIKGNEAILMEIKNTFRNFEDLLCCLILKITNLMCFVFFF